MARRIPHVVRLGEEAFRRTCPVVPYHACLGAEDHSATADVVAGVGSLAVGAALIGSLAEEACRRAVDLEGACCSCGIGLSRRFVLESPYWTLVDVVGRLAGPMCYDGQGLAYRELLDRVVVHHRIAVRCWISEVDLAAFEELACHAQAYRHEKTWRHVDLEVQMEQHAVAFLAP